MDVWGPFASCHRHVSRPRWPLRGASTCDHDPTGQGVYGATVMAILPIVRRLALLLAVGGVMAACATGASPSPSSSGGREWHLVDPDPVGLGGPFAVVDWHGGYVGVGGGGGEWDGQAWSSTDGTTWTASGLPSGGQPLPSDLVATPDSLLAVGCELEGERELAVVWTSVDGVRWTQIPADPNLAPHNGYRSTWLQAIVASPSRMPARWRSRPVRASSSRSDIAGPAASIRSASRACRSRGRRPTDAPGLRRPTLQASSRGRSHYRSRSIVVPSRARASQGLRLQPTGFSPSVSREGSSARGRRPTTWRQHVSASTCGDPPTGSVGRRSRLRSSTHRRNRSAATRGRA